MNKVKIYDIGGHACISIPSKIKKIEKDTFSGCIRLKNVKIPECVEEIGFAAFGTTSIEDIEIPASVKKSVNLAFIIVPVLKVLNLKK